MQNDDNPVNRILGSIDANADNEERTKAAGRARLKPVTSMLDELGAALRERGSPFEVVRDSEEVFLSATYSVAYYARNQRAEAIRLGFSTGPSIGGSGILYSVEGLDLEGLRNIRRFKGDPDPEPLAEDVYGFAPREISFEAPDVLPRVRVEIERMLTAYFR